jgi:hypothetical protein
MEAIGVYATLEAAQAVVSAEPASGFELRWVESPPGTWSVLGKYTYLGQPMAGLTEYQGRVREMEVSA